MTDTCTDCGAQIHSEGSAWVDNSGGDVGHACGPSLAVADKNSGVCPLCGYPPFEEPVDGFLVCSRCAEVLEADELVAEATDQTRATYLNANPSTITDSKEN